MTLLFIGTTELLLIAGVALLFFGGKKLPEMMRGLKQFKEGMKDVTEPIEESINPKEQNNSDSQTEQSNKTDNLTHSESKKQEVDEAQGK